MVIIFIAFTLILTSIFPVGSTLFSAIITSLNINANHYDRSTAVLMSYGMVISNYLISALIVWAFFWASDLKQRLPEKTPGIGLMKGGLAISLIYTAFYILATRVEGGGAAFVVLSLGVYFLWPGKLLMLAGAVKVLLSAKPHGND